MFINYELDEKERIEELHNTIKSWFGVMKPWLDYELYSQIEEKKEKRMNDDEMRIDLNKFRMLAQCPVTPERLIQQMPDRIEREDFLYYLEKGEKEYIKELVEINKKRHEENEGKMAEMDRKELAEFYRKELSEKIEPDNGSIIVED